MLPTLRALVRTSRADDFGHECPSLTELLHTSCQLRIFAFRPLSLLKTTSNRIVPSTEYKRLAQVEGFGWSQIYLFLQSLFVRPGSFAAMRHLQISQHQPYRDDKYVIGGFAESNRDCSYQSLTSPSLPVGIRVSKCAVTLMQQFHLLKIVTRRCSGRKSA